MYVRACVCVHAHIFNQDLTEIHWLHVVTVSVLKSRMVLGLFSFFDDVDIFEEPRSEAKSLKTAYRMSHNMGLPDNFLMLGFKLSTLTSKST